MPWFVWCRLIAARPSCLFCGSSILPLPARRMAAWRCWRKWRARGLSNDNCGINVGCPFAWDEQWKRCSCSRRRGHVARLTRACLPRANSASLWRLFAAFDGHITFGLAPFPPFFFFFAGIEANVSSRRRLCVLCVCAPGGLVPLSRRRAPTLVSRRCEKRQGGRRLRRVIGGNSRASLLGPPEKKKTSGKGCDLLVRPPILPSILWAFSPSRGRMLEYWKWPVSECKTSYCVCAQ